MAALLLLVAGGPCLAHEDPRDEITDVTGRIDAAPDAARYVRRAELHRVRREWADAIADLQSARSLDPQLASADFLTARVLFDADNPAAALPAVERFLAGHSDHANAHLLRGRILSKTGMHEEAAAALTTAIDLERASGGRSQPDDYLDRANELASLGESRIDDAIRGLDEGVLALGGAISLELRALELETSHAKWDAALARLGRLEASAHRKEPWIARRADVLARAGSIDTGNGPDTLRP